MAVVGQFIFSIAMDIQIKIKHQTKLNVNKKFPIDIALDALVLSAEIR